MIKSRQKLEWIQTLKERNPIALRSTFFQVFHCVFWQFMQHTGDRSQVEIEIESRSHHVQKNQKSEFRSPEWLKTEDRIQERRKHRRKTPTLA